MNFQFLLPLFSYKENVDAYSGIYASRSLTLYSFASYILMVAKLFYMIHLLRKIPFKEDSHRSLHQNGTRHNRKPADNCKWLLQRIWKCIYMCDLQVSI